MDDGQAGVLTLGGLGENALLARLLRGLPQGADVIAGPGDDCAILGRPRDRTWTLFKADCVVEGIHFESGADSRKVGWKALCRAISDIAAMGGQPRHALVTLAAPRSTEVRWLDGLYAGLRKAAKRFDVGIVGGETARSQRGVFVNVALTGEVDRSRCIRRSGGKPGDLLYVTGRLGGSIAGHHLGFTPRLAEARWLAEHTRVRAMMDLSDGLAADLPRLAAASGCGFVIDPDRLPRQRGCTAEQALGDGEDYELLFAVPASTTGKLETRWRLAFPRVPLSRIGALAPARSVTPSVSLGFDHFLKHR
jgi:thiamine-monophosphate kinase